MTQPDKDTMLWTVERTAKELSLSKAHIYRMVREKRIPFIRISDAAIRFSPAALQQWQQDRTVQAVK